MYSMRQMICSRAGRVSRLPGNITIFATIGSLLVSQVLFTFLESARLIELRKVARLYAATSTESIFAAYSQPLWEEYSLLGYEHTTRGVEGDLADLGAYDTDTLSTNLVTPALASAQVTGYTLMTDDEGRVFEEAVTDYIIQNLGYEMINSFQNYESAVNDLEEDSDGDLNYYMDSVEDAIELMKEGLADTSGSGGGHSISYRTLSLEEDLLDNTITNPLDLMAQSVRYGYIGFILEDPELVSSNSVTSSELLSRRELEEGEDPKTYTMNIWNTLSMAYFIDRHYGTYLNPGEDTALAYEQEYILNGWTTDRANLEATIYRILVLRIAANITSIAADEDKTEQVKAFGEVVADLIGEPDLKDVFAYAVTVSWAYIEGVLDLRSLMQGKTIALIKDEEEWTTELLALPLYYYGGSYAKECDSGLTYENYLQTFLFMEGEKNKNYRCMDLIEQNIRQATEYEDFQMDHIACELRVTYTYEDKLVFLSLVNLVSHSYSSFQYEVSEEYSYLEESG